MIRQTVINSIEKCKEQFQQNEDVQVLIDLAETIVDLTDSEIELHEIVRKYSISKCVSCREGLTKAIMIWHKRQIGGENDR